MRSTRFSFGALTIGLCAAWLALAGASRGAEYYVATTGNDTHPGTQSQPFATLGRARDVIRALPRPLAEDIVVWIGGGTYAITQPILFDASDSGSTAHAITYQGEPGPAVRISGGRRITGWTQHAGNIWKAQVPGAAGGAWPFRYLWANGRRLTRARHPNGNGLAMWMITEVTSDYLQVKLDHDIPAAWDFSKNDIELVLETEWTNSRDIVDHVTSNRLFMKSTVGLVNNANVCAKVGNRAFLENAYAMIDQPEEWYLDRASGTLYVCLTAEADPNAMEIIAPVSGQLLKAAGTRDLPITNLHFKNLEFAHTDWPLPAEGYAGIQACVYASGQYTPAEGIVRKSYMMPLAVHLEYTRNCSIERCRVRSVAGNGLGLACGCLDNLIKGCEIGDTAANGMMVSWIAEIPKANWYYWWSTAGRQYYHVNRRNTIDNCYIHDVGQEFWEGVGLLESFSEATHVTHCEFAHTGEAGMVIGYCWDPVETPESKTLIENNDIHHFCEKLGDNGGIYTLGFNLDAFIRGNYIHHNLRRPPTYLESPSFGLYYDQASKNWTAENNVLYLTQTPGFARTWNEPVNINVTYQNTVRNNYIHCHDTGYFRYTSTPEDYLTQEGNVTLSDPGGLKPAAVKAIVENAGLEPEYRALLHPEPAAQLRHRYTFDTAADRGADSVGAVPMWLDHGPYTWPAGYTGKASDAALGLGGGTGIYGGISLDHFKEDLGEQFSFAMWIKPEEKTIYNNTQSLIANTYPGSQYQGFLWMINGYNTSPTQPDDGMLSFQTSDGASQTAPFSEAGAVRPGGGWQHVAVTVDKINGKVRGYADGVKVIDSVLETYFESGQKYLFIGSVGNNYNFQGAIDDVRIYRGLLSDEQVGALKQWNSSAAGRWWVDCLR